MNEQKKDTRRYGFISLPLDLLQYELITNLGASFRHNNSGILNRCMIGIANRDHENKGYR